MPQSSPGTELTNIINTFEFEKSCRESELGRVLTRKRNTSHSTHQRWVALRRELLSVLRVSQKRKRKCSGGKLKKLVLPH